MKNINRPIKIASSFVMMLILLSCAKNFDELNIPPNVVKQENLDVDNTELGAAIRKMQTSIMGHDNGSYQYQLQQNLNGDLYSGFFGVPTPFAGGQNNFTYHLVTGWNNWALFVPIRQVMPQWHSIAQKTNNGEEFPEIHAVSLIMKVLSVHRATDVYGPIPYSSFGQAGATSPYDSQEDVYKQFFTELDDAIVALTAFLDNPETKEINRLSKYDIMYGGDYAKWIKFANSLRLRLAMRIAYVDADEAQAQAQKSIAQKYGVMTENGDNAVASSSGQLINSLNVIANDYGDVRMGANAESFLVGYADPRLSEYFSEAKEGGGYHGINYGTLIDAKSDYQNTLSNLGPRFSTDFKSNNPIIYMTYAEVLFLLAEGNLRGWNLNAQSIQELYEEGIKASFAQWGVSGSDYIEDNTSVPAPFTDVVSDLAALQNVQPNSTITIQWDEGAGKDEKLERIITQKWIALFPDGQEAWSEFRRTGYPKLFDMGPENSSLGVIDSEIMIRRLPFTESERNNNTAEVEKAKGFLKGEDNAATRLWWDEENKSIE